MVFTENDIQYYRDMRFWVGIPTGIDFQVSENRTYIVLTAPGYGGHPYGSGSIYLTKGECGEFEEELLRLINQKESEK